MDMNSGLKPSLQPVEHIRWLEGEAPEGEYNVSVKLFNYRSGTPLPIPFTVCIKANNEVKEFFMEIRGGMFSKKKHVHTFLIGP